MSVARELLRKFVLERKEQDGTVDAQAAARWLQKELRAKSPEEADRLDVYGYTREASDVISSLRPREIGIANQLGLWADSVQALAPIGKGRFKFIANLQESEFQRYADEYLADITGRRKTYDALDAIRRACRPFWRKYPDWTVAECLKRSLGTNSAGA